MRSRSVQQLRRKSDAGRGSFCLVHRSVAALVKSLVSRGGDKTHAIRQRGGGERETPTTDKEIDNCQYNTSEITRLLDLS